MFRLLERALNQASGRLDFWKTFFFSPMRHVMREVGATGRKPSLCRTHVLTHVWAPSFLPPSAGPAASGSVC